MYQVTFELWRVRERFSCWELVTAKTVLLWNVARDVDDHYYYYLIWLYYVEEHW